MESLMQDRPDLFCDAVDDRPDADAIWVLFVLLGISLSLMAWAIDKLIRWFF